MLALCLIAVCCLPVKADVLHGDVNSDGKASIDDVVELIDYLLSGDAVSIDLANADVDHDGRVSIDDVVELIDLLLTQSNSPDPVEGDWVDLGLPSGTLWATCNVGASAPEEYGDYFAWGETEPQSFYDYYWETYKWWRMEGLDANGVWHTQGLTKYCNDNNEGSDGFMDNKTVLDPEDDAAYVNWGSSWRMPSFEQLVELCQSCTWERMKLNGVDGRLVTGPNGNTMFLPAAGRLHGGGTGGGDGYYWSRTLDSDPSVDSVFSYHHLDSPVCARCLYFRFGYDYWMYRAYGLPVRAVRIPQN